MKVQIRLLKDWKNGETTHPAGQLLKCSKESAQPLIDQGIAEIYVPAVGDIIELNNGDSGMSKDELSKVFKEFLAEANKNTDTAKHETDELAKTGGFVNFADFLHQTYRSKVDDEQTEKMSAWMNHAKATGMSEAVNSDGGFLVPTEFRNTLLQDALQASVIEPMATVIPMQSNTIKIPLIDESTRAGSVFGGIIIYRPGEGGTKNPSKPKFGSIQLSLHKLIGLCYVTDELLEDSPISLQPLLSRMFSEAISFQKDDDFLNGTGAGMPLGILNADCLISVAKESSQGAATIEPQNLYKMRARLKPRSWGKANWVCNQTLYPQLRELTVSIGTGGSIVPLLTHDPGGVTMLDGLPIRFMEQCQTLGTKGDIVLADWRQYLIGQKAAGIQFASSIHVQFVTDETAFRFVLRYDGQPWERTTRQPKRGDTVGSFITLDERS